MARTGARRGRETAADARARGPGRQFPAAMLAGASVMLGFWLLLAPTFLGYERQDTGMRSFWNDLVVGGVLLVVGLARMANPHRLAPLGGVGIALGIWLLLAPALLDHPGGPNHPVATVNDVVVGILVLASSVAGTVIGLRAGADDGPASR